MQFNNAAQACQGLSVVREAQAQGVCASELVPGHLPNEEVEARHGGLYGHAKKVVHRARTARPGVKLASAMQILCGDAKLSAVARVSSKVMSTSDL